MGRLEIEALVSTYEDDFEAIQSVLDDDGLTASEKLDAIADVVDGDDDDNQLADVGGEDD